VKHHAQQIDDFIGEMKAAQLAPCTIANFVKGIKALYRINEIPLHLPYHLKARVRYHDRAPTPEEVAQLINLADIREKTIISLLALGGFRIGTLVQLQYRHVQYDLKRKIVPVHLHIESDITKGKYGDYDTFIGTEAITYLNAYLQMRRTGTRKMPPETITSTSPIIRNERSKTVKPVSTYSIYRLIHNLLLKTNLITKSAQRRYDLRPHSFRKYFRTQLGTVTSIPIDFVEYWMGHTISTYNDVRMKGIDYMRNLYDASGLSIRPKTTISKIDRLKMFAESLGLNPDDVLSRDALTLPHRTVINGDDHTIQVLNHALKHAIIQEMQGLTQ
jgi:integrase